MGNTKNRWQDLSQHSFDNNQIWIYGLYSLLYHAQYNIISLWRWLTNNITVPILKNRLISKFQNIDLISLIYQKILRHKQENLHIRRAAAL